MDQWQERQKTFENKFSHDETLRFQIIFQRNVLLYHWIKEIIGADIQSLENEARKFAFEHMHKDDAILVKIIDQFFKDQSCAQPLSSIRQTMAQFWDQSAQEIVGSEGNWLR